MIKKSPIIDLKEIVFEKIKTIVDAKVKANKVPRNCTVYGIYIRVNTRI